MTALDHALRLYGPDFARVHGIYVRHGYTYSDPDHLGLARPCREEKPEEWCEIGKADAWWVELAVGGMDVLMRKLPYSLPRIGWCRAFRGKPEPRFYDWQKLTEKLYGWNENQ